MQDLKNPMLFAFQAYETMASELIQIANLDKGEFLLKRFPNDELYLTLQTSVKERECIVLGSIAPPDTHFFSFMMLCHTLKKEKASKITAVLPYLAYSRHDKNEELKSHTIAMIAEILYRIGVDRIITFDIHSQAAKTRFLQPIISLLPIKLFADVIKSLSLQKVTIVAPDEGAVERCKMIAKKAGITSDIAYLKKQRTEEGVSHSQLYGHIEENLIIIDDILDTGGTLISCCKKLLSQGAKHIYIMVTHGLFTGNQWEKLWELGVDHIYCTNTIPFEPSSKKLTLLSITSLLGDTITQTNEEPIK